MSFDPTKPFRARDALKAGITRRELASPTYRRLLPGVYILSSVTVDALQEARAVLLVTAPDAFVSHHQAARLYGAVVPASEVLHASVPYWRHRSTKQGVMIHQSSWAPVRFKGVPVTSAVHTFLDLAGLLGLVDLVVLGDSLVKRGRCTPKQLRDAAAAAPDRVRRHAQRAAGLVRAQVDSPMETRLRLLLVFAGLPEPEVNIVIRHPDGTIRRRIDMGYSAVRLGVEYDGRQHVTVVEQWEGDVLRREEFANEEWRLVTVIAKDIYRTPGATLQRVTAAMSSRGMDVPVLKDDWRRHFPELSD